MSKDLIGVFDLDVTLRDASLDEHVRPTRRMIAAATIGIDPQDAFYSVRELKEAAEWVHEDRAGAHLKLTTLLGNTHDDYQRCLYFCLAGRGVVEMLDDLAWLEDLVTARGRVAAQVRRDRRRKVNLVNPYVSDRPDGPLVAPCDRFELGPSWSYDPTL